MRIFRFLLSMTLIGGMALTLSACGGNNTQKKVDAANADLDRMGQIDKQLRSQKIEIDSMDKSKETLSQMNGDQRANTDKLLAEFIQRGQNVISTAQQKNVRFPQKALENVKLWVQQAQQLRKEISSSNGDSSKASAEDSSKALSKASPKAG